MTAKFELFYTGGGITIAEADIDSARYAVVSSEAPDFLTVYTLTDEEKNVSSGGYGSKRAPR